MEKPSPIAKAFGDGDTELHRQLLAEAAALPDREICGLLFGEGRVDAVVPVVNVADDPTRQFELDGAALFAAIRAERAGGARLFGYYHSHPQGPPTPSSHDVQQASHDGRIWLIIGEGRVTAWQRLSADFVEIELTIDR